MRDVRFGAFWGRVMTPGSRRAASRSRGVSLVCGLLVFGPPLRDGLLPRAASFPRAVRPRRLLRDGAQSSVGKAPRGVGFYTSKKRRPAFALRNLSHPRIGVRNALRPCFAASSRNRPKSRLWCGRIGVSFGTVLEALAAASLRRLASEAVRKGTLAG